MTTTTLIDIKADYARLLAPFCSTEISRYHLHGYQVEPCPHGGALLLATDGHRMGIFHDASGSIEGPPRIVQLAKTVLKACKAAPREDSGCDRRLRLDGCAAEIYYRKTADEFEQNRRDGRVVLSVPTSHYIDATFPEWRRVLPSHSLGSEAPAISVNTRLLAAFGAVDESQKLMVSPAPRESGFGVGGPAWVTTSRTDFIGIIMPVPHARSHTVPTWLKPTAAELAA